jgi:transposase-like protein
MNIFSESDKKRLLSSRWVEKVTTSHVVFTAQFKIKAVMLNFEGVPPSDIFVKFGIDISLFHENFTRKCLERWRKIYRTHGEDGFKTERRGVGSKGRPKKIKINPNDKDALIERIAYLEEENEFLKKLHALADVVEKKNSR